MWKRILKNILSVVLAVALLPVFSVRVFDCMDMVSGQQYLNTRYSGSPDFLHNEDGVQIYLYELYYEKNGSLICEGKLYNPFSYDVILSTSGISIYGTDTAGKEQLIAKAETPKGETMNKLVPSRKIVPITYRFSRRSHKRVDLNKIQSIKFETDTVYQIRGVTR